jgi:hypothetical protein
MDSTDGTSTSDLPANVVEYRRHPGFVWQMQQGERWLVQRDEDGQFKRTQEAGLLSGSTGHMLT